MGLDDWQGRSATNMATIVGRLMGCLTVAMYQIDCLTTLAQGGAREQLTRGLADLKMDMESAYEDADVRWDLRHEDPLSVGTEYLKRALKENPGTS